MAENANAFDVLSNDNPQVKLDFTYRIALPELIDAIESADWDKITRKTALDIVTHRYVSEFCFLYQDWGIDKHNKERLTDLNAKIAVICEEINLLSPYLKFECSTSQDLTNGGTVKIDCKTVATFNLEQLSTREENLRFVIPIMENPLERRTLEINKIALGTFLHDLYGFQFYLPYSSFGIDENDMDRLNKLNNLVNQSCKTIPLNLKKCKSKFECLTCYESGSGAVFYITEKFAFLH